MNRKFLALGCLLPLAAAIAQTSQKKPTMPADEQRLVSILASFKQKYDAAANEFQKSAIRRQRAAALKDAMPTLSVSGWIGKISKMETTGDGYGVLYVQPLGASWATFETMNNGLSDVRSKTLIRPDSPLYDRISACSVGMVIEFDGEFLPGEDHLYELSITEAGSMDEPELVFRFAAIRPNPQ